MCPTDLKEHDETQGSIGQRRAPKRSSSARIAQEQNPEAAVSARGSTVRYSFEWVRDSTDGG
jgi:hypothetical protein